MNEAKGEIEEIEEKLQALKSQYHRFKSILGQTQQARSMRVTKPTTYEIISDTTNSTRYRRRQETKDVLEYIHGSEIGAINGAWDIIAKYASDEIIKKLFTSYKRAKYLEGIFGKSTTESNKSEDALKPAVALKYQNYLSRGKMKLTCKTQSSVYDADRQLWLPRNVKCLDVDIALPKITSNEKIDKFIKGLDIGNISQISNYPGVSRTVTG